MSTYVGCSFCSTDSCHLLAPFNGKPQTIAFPRNIQLPSEWPGFTAGSSFTAGPLEVPAASLPAQTKLPAPNHQLAVTSFQHRPRRFNRQTRGWLHCQPKVAGFTAGPQMPDICRPQNAGFTAHSCRLHCQPKDAGFSPAGKATPDARPCTTMEKNGWLPDGAGFAAGLAPTLL